MEQLWSIVIIDAFLYGLPAWHLFILVGGGSETLAWIGTVLQRHKTTEPMDEKHNEVAGFIFATIGVLYAVLLAFTVIIVWEQYLAAESSVPQEAAALITVAHDTPRFLNRRAARFTNSFVPMPNL